MTEKRIVELTELCKSELSLDFRIVYDGEPIDKDAGIHLVDVYKNDVHVALCLWNKNNGYAINILPKNPDDLGFENPRYSEPFYSHPQEVVDVLRGL